MLLDFLVASFACHRRDGIIGRRSLRNVSFAFAADTIVSDVAAVGLDVSRSGRTPDRGESNAVVHILVAVVVVWLSTLCPSKAKAFKQAKVGTFSFHQLFASFEGSVIVRSYAVVMSTT